MRWRIEGLPQDHLNVHGEDLLWQDNGALIAKLPRASLMESYSGRTVVLWWRLANAFLV